MAEHETTDTRDLAKKPGLSLDVLENFLGELDLQPIWRTEAARAADYYDGKQLESHVVSALRDRGQAPLVFNLIAPTIDAVLGMEAKTRTDWLVRADNDDGLEVAEGLNEELNEAARMALANRSCSDAYAAQVKTGMGWVEVNRNTDPFAYGYRTQYIHRREIYWDWHAKRPDLKDARYMVREKWLDEDQAILAFPEHKELINHAVTAWSQWTYTFDDADSRTSESSLHHSYEDFQNSGLGTDYWFDIFRRRVRTYEVWYRQWVKGVALKLKDGRVITYDKSNPIHVAAVASGAAKPQEGMYPVMRLAYYLGPHRIMDIPSPLPHDNFPYVPFWGFREDSTSIPYGLIRRMMSPQDEVNARRSKMMWLLTAKRIIMDSDASKQSIEEVADEVSRPDGIVLLNPNRKHRDANSFKVEQDFQLAAQQFEVMKDAEGMINQTGGVYQTFMGQNEGDQSGVAISNLVEQSSTTLAELNDNFRFGRQMVGEHLLALIVQDIDKEQKDVVVNANKPKPTKVIKLNHRVQDPDTGHAQINNDVMRTKARVVLDDIQATAGYRSQVSNRLFDLAATLPDNVKAAVLPIVIESTDIPQREEMMKAVRQATGMGADPNDMTPEEQEQLKAQQEEEAKKRQQEFDQIDADIGKVRAETKRINSEAESNKYDDRKTEAETEKLVQEMEALTKKVASLEKDQLDGIDADNEALEVNNLLSQVDMMEGM